MRKRLDEIRRENNQWAKEAPYNYCDRWCERCSVSVKQGCRLYLDEVGREAFNIAHGRDPEDVRVLEEDLSVIEEALETTLSQHGEDFFDADLDPGEVEKIQKEQEAIDQKARQHHLQRAARQYYLKAKEFLETIGFPAKHFSADIQYHLHTIAWYHTLISAKMHRALTGLYESSVECFDEFALHDCVAQLDICRKGVDKSLNAFQAVGHLLPPGSAVNYSLAMLNNIKDQIDFIEKDIEESL